METIEAKQNELRSILRNSSEPTGRRSESDAREIAIAHAKRIQHRKDLEADILDSLILLSEYPLVRSSAYSASNPAPSDASGFKTHTRLFQPSDYDDLIEERNVNELCGYSLCPNPRRKIKGGPKWKLVSSGQIMLRETLEKWCSAACAKRALFVKVQLNETAAWERAGIPEIQIDLMDEGQPEAASSDETAGHPDEATLTEKNITMGGARQLAMERGDRTINEEQSRVKVLLKERTTKPPATDDLSAFSANDHLCVDGHVVHIPLRPRQNS
ncbi:DUF408 domain protein [Moelleriella libera RCEF 2490]|uniref:RNA polymerase II subunit B1 CTD phosphatase RPAP2 homolog n=1 Tax=Moelleriella libera RCEF 2490 TaxID=1081109 RepID=A0A167ZEV6_9HYPO|nr:DUF408 domain protein [Moelleriella libera RCEF 2490]